MQNDIQSDKIGRMSKTKKRVQKTKENVYNFIVSFKSKTNGRAPTIREIKDGCKLSSTSVVEYYLFKLERDGIIKFQNGRARNISIPGEGWVCPPSPFENSSD